MQSLTRRRGNIANKLVIVISVSGFIAYVHLGLSMLQQSRGTGDYDSVYALDKLLTVIPLGVLCACSFGYLLFCRQGVVRFVSGCLLAIFLTFSTFLFLNVVP